MFFFIFIGSVLSFLMKSDALNMVLDMLNHFARWVLGSRCSSMLASHNPKLWKRFQTLLVFINQTKCFRSAYTNLV